MSTVRQALQSVLDESGGAMPFDVFMGIALHHAGDGYYARNIRGIGTRGDFTTVPQVTPALGHAVTGWLRAEAAARGWKSYAVIECGPGDGSLAEGVMKSFGWLERRRLSLHLVETSNPLRTQQARRLGRKAVWHETIAEALAACDGRALIYHNEFFDAFPCRVFRRQAGAWTELHLKVAGGRLTEAFLSPQRPRPDSGVFRRDWPEEQRVEVFASARDWMRELSASWHAGAMLALDYGGTTAEIFHRRPGGTLRAYRGQQRLTGEAVCDMPGRQDITADVNFEDLAQWASELGWSVGPSKSLGEFVGGAELRDAGAAFRALTLSRRM
ncbi:MAG: SAM-dependent methyltransferase [Chthoniobacterales bacterium]